MKRIQELYNKLNTKREEIKNLRDAGKTEEAHAMLADVQNLQREIDLEKDAEKAQKQQAQAAAAATISRNEPSNEINVAFNRAVLGNSLTEEQAALVGAVGEDGGYLVPVEQKTEIVEYKRQLISLKEFTNVIPVTTKTGSLPTEVEDSDTLIKFAEMSEINQSTIKFGQSKWDVEDYGDIIPVSNTLLQDEAASLMSFIKRRFGKKAVRTENMEILSKVAGLQKHTGDSWRAVRFALNRILDPVFKTLAIVLTNQEGFDYLDSLEDKNGRPLLTASLADPDVYLFKGRQIVVLSDVEYPGVAGKKSYYVGSLFDAVNFYDREQYEIAISTEAGFTKNATFLRAIERFDTRIGDLKAMVHVEITLTPEEEEILAAGATLPLTVRMKEVNEDAVSDLSDLSKMTKEDLLTLAEQLDIDVPVNATKAVLAELINEAQNSTKD